MFDIQFPSSKSNGYKYSSKEYPRTQGGRASPGFTGAETDADRMPRKQSVKVEEGRKDEDGDGDRRGSVAFFRRPPESRAGVIVQDENTFS